MADSDGAMTVPGPAADGELPRFMTVAEIAALLRVSRATVYRLVNSGALQATDIGRSVRVAHPAVEEFLRRRVRPAADPRANDPDPEPVALSRASALDTLNRRP